MDENIGVNVQETAAPAMESQSEATADLTSEVAGVTAEPAAQPERDLEHDRVAAAARRRAEAEFKAKEADYKKQLDALKKEHERLAQEAKAVAGTEQGDIADQLRAMRTGKTIEEVRAEREKEETIASLQSQLQSFQQMFTSQVYEKDLAAINQAFPDAKLESVDDLPEEFFKLRSSDVSPTVAFRVLREEIEKERKPTPPPIGSAKSSGAAEKEFFTDDELGKLTSKDLDKPGVLEKALKSLRKKG